MCNPERRPGISDAHPLFAVSGLLFDFSFLSPLSFLFLFFSLYLILLLLFLFCHFLFMAHSPDFFGRKFSKCFVDDDDEVMLNVFGCRLTY